MKTTDKICAKSLKFNSEKHAKKVLGEEQYNKNINARRAIISDFKAGVRYALQTIFVR